jgi:hypothetical protein
MPLMTFNLQIFSCRNSGEMAESSLKLLFLKFELEICNISFTCDFFNSERAAEAFFFNLDEADVDAEVPDYNCLIECTRMNVDSGTSCGIIHPREAEEQRCAAWAGSVSVEWRLGGAVSCARGKYQSRSVSWQIQS